MIKFEMFETENSYQCHFSQIGVFVVSIAHYMRAYFNHLALEQGKDFSIPSDAGYLNCILISSGNNNNNNNGESDNTMETAKPLYAKIGCMERETFTSTKLQLHVYTDSQCSVPYDDGQTGRYHASRGYLLENARNEQFLFPTKVQFRPPFYTCQSCTVDQISETFNKKSGSWYDDDYISQNGQKANNNNSNNNGNANEENDDAANDDQAQQNADDQAADDYYRDDTYMSANDDIYRYNNGNNNYNYNNGGNRGLLSTLRGQEDRDIELYTPVPRELKVCLLCICTFSRICGTFSNTVSFSSLCLSAI
jgi:hypothetical protein